MSRPMAPIDHPHNANVLMNELLAAALPVVTLDSAGTLVRVYVDDDATPEDEAAVSAVVDAHAPTPTPITHTQTEAIDAQVRTTDDQPKEVLRFACATGSLYEALLTVSGIDASSFASKVMEGRFTWKRTTGNAIMVGVTVVSDIHDTAAASWSPSALPDGSAIVFTVKGAAGRTIDWLLVGSVGVFTPSGVTP